MTTVCIDASVLVALVLEPSITWISASAQRLFSSIMGLCREHEGRLNYHDALIALACQELKIGLIVSFDGDFDRLAWLTRFSTPEHISRRAE